MKLANYTMDYFKQEVIDAFFPRALIVSKKDGILEKIVRDSIKKLNSLCFQPRFYEFNVTGSAIDLTQMDAENLDNETVSGIEIDRIQYVIPSNDSNLLGDFYKSFNLKPFFSYNLLRHHDDFLEYIFANELQKQMNKKYYNKNVNAYFKAGNQLILNQRSYQNVAKALVFFLPKFKFDKQTLEWELSDEEEEFVNSYVESLTGFREGRAQSEMNIMDLTTNADDLKNDHKEELKEIVDIFRKIGFTNIGKVF